MHSDELEIGEALVRSLLEQQFPQWAHRPIVAVEPRGTVSAIFRLGDELSVRLARRNGRTQPGTKEREWLPALGRRLPVDVPMPVAEGKPTSEYPWYWDVQTWVHGETVSVEEIDAIQAARDLATLIRALQRIDPTGAPEGRGIALAKRDAEFRYWLARYRGNPNVSREWDRALSASVWNGPPVWHHGDLDSRNWLVKAGRISGVIDWGSMGVGDPACDVMVAWKLHSPFARDAFRNALPTDDSTWERARGWVLSQAVAILAYYTLDNNPVLYREAEAWLKLVMAEAD